MALKNPIYTEFDLNATSGYSKIISLTHTDDDNVDVIELCVKQSGAPTDLTGSTAIARMVLHGSPDVLISDNVECTINGAGNILIPFDNASIESRKGIVKIEVNVTRSPDILTLQLPLRVKINGSILESATIDPHSEGTIPELLKTVREELERVRGFATVDDVFNVIDEVFSATGADCPRLCVELYEGDYWLTYYDSEEEEAHRIFNFSTLPQGSSDYEELENKPQINGITLSGNKRNSDLGFSNFYYSENNPTIYASPPAIYQVNDVWINTTTNTAFRLESKSSSNLSWQPLRVKVFLSDEVPPQSERQSSNSLIYNAGDIWIHRTLYNSGSTRPFYGLNGLYICVGSARQSQSPYNQFNITWQRIDNKVQSGVVNSDGTITFANSDGTTFTTTGSSVIGPQGPAGADGSDYVLTAQDKSDIADIVLSELPTTQGVLYGNTSN